MKTFTVNNKAYTTDADTLKVLRQYRTNPEMFGIVMSVGLRAGRIKEIQ